jgi:lysozyme
MSTIQVQLEHEEGRQPKPYTDSTGNLTIGIGRNLTGIGLYDDEIDYLLANDLKRVTDALNKNLPWWIHLDTVRQKVLIDMCFNMGIEKLLQFHNTLHWIMIGNYANAKLSMLSSLWAKQVGIRAINLATMLETGIDLNFK